MDGKDYKVEVDNTTDGKDGTTKRNWKFWQKWCRHGCPFWCRKYFWEGQLKRGATDEGLEEVVNTAGPCDLLSPGRRKLVGWLLPAAIFHIAYWSIVIERDLIYVFKDKYPMTITMIIGSIIAGMTSVGGGAVAFPVMSLVLGEPPAIGRDLAMSLQSCGMSAASFSIFFMHVHIELHALVFGLLGSASGVIFGLELVDPHLTPAMKKMGFSGIFFAFAFALFLLNWNPKRRTVNNIVDLNWWKRIVIVFTGFLGGIFTSFSGSGADICVFSVLTLLFKLSEKVATPTSVVLMAMTSCVGWFWRSLVTQTMPLASWEYLLCVIPIVTVGAPFGALLGSHFHRLVLAACVYIIDTASLIGAFCIVPQTPSLAGGTVALIVFMFIVYYVLSKLGEKMYQSHLEKNQKIIIRRNTLFSEEIMTSDILQNISSNHNTPNGTAGDVGKQNGVNNVAFVSDTHSDSGNSDKKDEENYENHVTIDTKI